ncbi:PEP-CTERM sorting domain-containing protein [candidate division GN15 bacterium]|nr:PEP-CTERM sorting domain-containing protein [candidate division GN15 bacterium]
MVVYRQKSYRWLRWLIFAIVFFLGMTVTFTDVEGIGVGAGRDRVDRDVDRPSIEKPIEPDTPRPSDDNPPAAIPEPTTMLLMGMGLGAAYLIRRRREQK